MPRSGARSATVGALMLLFLPSDAFQSCLRPGFQLELKGRSEARVSGADAMGSGVAGNGARALRSRLQVHVPFDGSRATNEHGFRFEGMLRRCQQYDDELMESIPDMRLRGLVKGVVDGSRTPEVVNAFRILYEDYVPLRVAGDFIFNRVDGILVKTKREGATGAAAMRQTEVRLTDSQKRAERTYEHMLRSMAEWEAALDEGKFAQIRNQRLGNVLIGCFTGARTGGVVEALRILYCDYRVLRTGGNLIFQLMKGAVRPYVDQRRVRSVA